MTRLATLVPVCCWAAILAQEPSPKSAALGRRYREGEKVTYRMTGVNEGRRYEVRAAATVKRDAAGAYVEEVAWSDLILGETPFALPPGSREFRQILSLDPARAPSMPDLTKVHPMLIGPVTDLMTFYVDLWLAARSGKLARAGDRAYHRHGTPASWADGSRVILGQSSIDFDMTLADMDPSRELATLVVRHVPPQQPEVNLPAAWMREPVAGTPNNWVQVSRKDDKFTAAVGQETFDVRIRVSLADGKMLSGTMDNLVQAVERDCTGSVLSNCGSPRPRRIQRRITVVVQ
jgi:hypothetical protein